MAPFATTLLANWRRLSGLPGGKRLFSLILGRAVPYSGSVRPLVLELSPGHAKVQIVERRALRQHLGSVHAIALANVGELTSGLAMIAGLPPTVRGIVIGIEMDFLKKARGRLTTTADVTIPSSVPGPMEHLVGATTRNDAGEVVAEIRVRWRLAPAGAAAAAPAGAGAAPLVQRA